MLAEPARKPAHFFEHFAAVPPGGDNAILRVGRSATPSGCEIAFALVEDQEHLKAFVQRLAESQAVIDRIADKKIIHKNAASRYKSRLSAAIKSMGESAASS